MTNKEKILQDSLDQVTERSDLLEAALAQVQISHPWLLACVKGGEDENVGNYGLELLHAISAQEILEVL